MNVTSQFLFLDTFWQYPDQRSKTHFSQLILHIRPKKPEMGGSDGEDEPDADQETEHDDDD